MAITRSDNRYEKHPKPVQEYERKFSAGAYSDWASEAEVNSEVPLTYRRNKYFWIAGVLHHCGDNGTTYRTVSSSGAAGAEIISITNQTEYEVTWTTEREENFGSIPRGVEFLLQTEQGYEKVGIVIVYDDMPPSFTKVTAYLPGQPGKLIVY